MVCQNQCQITLPSIVLHIVLGLEMGCVTVNDIETVCLLKNYSNCLIEMCMLKNKNRLSKCLSRNVV